jgi:hypothetical protein
MASRPIIRTTDSELQRIFNQACFLTRTLDRTFRTRPYGPQVPVYTPGEPDGTMSGLIEVIDPMTDSRVGLAHRYERPDGSYGASGKPDPKLFEVDGVTYGQAGLRHPVQDTSSVQPTCQSGLSRR